MGYREKGGRCYPAACSPSDPGIASLMPISRTPFFLAPITVISQPKYFSGIFAISPPHNASKVDSEYRQTLSNMYCLTLLAVISRLHSPCITRQGRADQTNILHPFSRRDPAGWVVWLSSAKSSDCEHI